MEEIERSLYDTWAGRDPRFEVRHEASVIRKLADYGIGANQHMADKAKVLGAGYEVFIMAFFIGLYSDKRLKLSDDIKKFGQPIQYWGNLDSKKGRKAYSQLREYIFVALVAKTDVDFIEMDKGRVKVSDAANALLQTMNEYANYGFYVLDQKLQDNPNYFYSQRAFFDIIWDLTQNKKENANDSDDSDEELEKW